ncbi:MAG: Transcriptional regulator, ArsR family [Candidatus Peregrinibacteria bacterium GW2011_GWA2_44_7]|nr:MAG: Transcriptional regulator, ArsR family [Candidatus Peregrinibacteria bacterium GW2011_GWA2_44_7]
MVEYTLNTLQLDSIFGSLADPTRRDILKRISHKELSISDIAEPYPLTFAAISKHLQILEKAKLIIKRRQGKQQLVHASPTTLKEATEYLKTYEKLWNDRLDSLEQYLSSLPPSP